MNEFKLTYSEVLQKADLDVVAEVLTMPAVKKYLQHLINHVVTEHANAPVAFNQDEIFKNAVQQAFSKGQLTAYHTLMSIEKVKQPINQPRS